MLLPLLLAALAAPQDLAFFEGPPGGTGDLRLIDPSGLAPDRHPADLRGLRLLALDFVGRADVNELLVECPRLRTDLPGGATRIELARGRGSLYAYGKDGDDGPRFGFLVVDGGGARSVLELPGVGVESPFLGRPALDAEGTGLLVVTRPEAGSRLLEVDLAGGGTVDRTPTGTWQPQVDGLALSAGFGLALAPGRLLRFDRAGADVAEPVSFEPVTPTWIGPDAVISADQGTAAFLAGSSAGLAYAWTVQATGAARRATLSSVGLTRLGYLPEFRDGPYLALAPDGSACAWMSEGASREVFFRRLARQTAPEYQVTADERFADTLSESGVIAFFSPTDLVVLLGDDSGGNPGIIEDGDFYGVKLPTQRGDTIEIRNLTASSGDVELPFLSYGTVTNDGRIHRLPGQDLLLVHEAEPARFSLVGLDGTRALPFPDAPLALERIESLDGEYLLQALVAGLPAPERVFLRLELDPDPRLIELGRVPLAGRIGPVATAPDGRFAAVAGLGTREWLGRSTAAGGLQSLLDRPLRFGPTLGFTPAGELVTTIRLNDGTSLFGSWGERWRFLTRERFEGFYLP